MAKVEIQQKSLENYSAISSKRWCFNVAALPVHRLLIGNYFHVGNNEDADWFDFRYTIRSTNFFSTLGCKLHLTVPEWAPIHSKANTKNMFLCKASVRDLSIDIPNGCFAFSGSSAFVFFCRSSWTFSISSKGYTSDFFSHLLNGFSHFFKKLRYFQQRTSIIKLKHKFLPSSHAALKLACHDCCLRFVRRTNPFGFARAWLNGGRMK